MSDGVWESSSPRPGNLPVPPSARPADRIDVHVADITHSPAGSPVVVLTLALRHRPGSPP